jgi:hypothetical protein
MFSRPNGDYIIYNCTDKRQGTGKKAIFLGGEKRNPENPR